MSATGTGENRARRAPVPPRTASLGALALTVALAGCAAGNIPSGRSAAPAHPAPAGETCPTGPLNGEGSSAQVDAMNRWRTVYHRRCPGTMIGYAPTGSGAGVKAFIAGKADFAGSDAPLSPEEQRSANQRCGGGPAIRLPMSVGMIALAYHVRGLLNLKLGPASVAKIFSGSVTRWDDAAIRADNPIAVLPPTPIRTVHRSDSSGTTENLTAFLADAAPGDWTFGHGLDWKAPGGTGANGSSGVAAAVGDVDGTIGYLEVSSAQDELLTVAGVRNGAGQFVQPTAEGGERTIGASTADVRGHDIRMDIDYATSRVGAYPIVLVTYELVCQNGLAPGKAALARSFLSYTASALGQRELTAVGYAALPEYIRGRVASAVESIR